MNREQFLSEQFSESPFQTPPASSEPWLAEFPEFKTIGQMRRAARPDLPWLWHGYLKPGGVTLLVSQWKSGKSTLVSILLSKMKSGGQLAGLPVSPGRAVVLSEEGEEMWAERGRKLEFHPRTCFICRPFSGPPTLEEWDALAADLAKMRHAHGIDLLVIDTLSSMLPLRGECNASLVLEALGPVQRLVREGMAVLALHHPRKGETLAGQASRGSGALCAYADAIVEMKWYARGAEHDRRRRMRAWSRYPETPGHLVIELNESGTDYVARVDDAEDEFELAWNELALILADAGGKLTRREIHGAWPGDVQPPCESTLWRWLDLAVAKGLAHVEGAGRKGRPFRYWLAEREAA